MAPHPSLAEILHSGTLISMKKDTLLLGWGEKQTFSIPKDPAFFLTDFFLQKKPCWFTHKYMREISVEDAKKIFKQENTNLKPLEWIPFFKEPFFKTIENVKELIKAGRLHKAVPYVFERCLETMGPSRLSSSLSQALRYIESYPCYLYGTWSHAQGLLGVTPEILFQKKLNNITTFALAGTASNHLLENKKNHHEHRIVIEGIQESLAPFGKFKTGPTYTLNLSKLKHLKTEMQLSLSENLEFEQIARVLHPTPALGAYPKKEGMGWLKEYDQKCPRLYYGAPIGFRQKEEEICYVAIRNVQWTDQMMFMGAGCGIVKDSQPDEEWDEIQLKIRSIKEMLAL